MRNLKKILALVLALVMSLSLMATAGATDFKDDGDISDTYRQAAQVLFELGVFNGDQNGQFNPDQPIARSEVAAILYRIATGDIGLEGNKTYAPYNQFPDVSAEDWYAGYVTYCANAGYIKGRNTGKFDAKDDVTGYEVLAMILRAVGYDKNNEFVGSNWQEHTASLATQKGVLVNVLEDPNVRLSQPATREVVAELLFRASLLPQVTYNAATLSYVEDGETLAKANLGMERIEGVVVANEWADLRYDYIDADEGETVLETADGERTLVVPTDLTDIGESRYAYVVGAKVLGQLEDTGKNVVKDCVDLEPQGSATYVSDLADELKLTDDTQYFVNFSDFSYDKSDYRIEYSISFRTEAAKEWFETKYLGYNYDLEYNAVPDGDVNEELIVTGKYYDKDDTASYTGKTFSRVIPAGDTITWLDKAIMRGIFASAASFDSKHKDFSELDENIVHAGYVYAGTKSNPDTSDTKADLSDDRTYQQFEDEYIGVTADAYVYYTTNGEWLKIIDNDSDGKADFVLNTVYALVEVDSYNTRNDAYYFSNGTDTEDYDYALRDSEYEFNVGDMLLMAYIDGQYVVEEAESEILVIDKYSWKEASVTTKDGETFYQSGAYINNTTGYGDQIEEMDYDVEYEVFYDHYGFIRAYRRLTSDRNYGLLTDLYLTDQRNTHYIDNQIATVELSFVDEDGKLVIDEYDVANHSKNDPNPFVGINQVAYDDKHMTDNLQRAIAHLGAIDVIPTYNDDVDEYEDSRTVLGEEFDYDGDIRSIAQNYNDNVTAGTVTTGDYASVKTDTQIDFSWTNIARYELNEDGTVDLYGAAEFAYDKTHTELYYWNSNGSDFADTSKITAIDGTVTFGVGGTRATVADWRVAFAQANGYTDTASADKAVIDAALSAKLVHVYAVDYVMLAKNAVSSSSSRFVIDSGYTAGSGNTDNLVNDHVNATSDTLFYIVIPGADAPIVVKGFQNLPDITDIHAIYALAQSVTTNSSAQDYWVADIVVIEAEQLVNADTYTYMIYNIYDNYRQGQKGVIHELDAIDCRTGELVTVIVDSSWRQAYATGFYFLSGAEKDNDGTLTATGMKTVESYLTTTGGTWNGTHFYSDYGIFAGAIVRANKIATAGCYIEVFDEPSDSTDSDTETVFVDDAPWYTVYGYSRAVAQNPTGRFYATELSNKDYEGNVANGDEIVYVTYKKAVVCVIDTSFDKLGYTPYYLNDGDATYGASPSDVYNDARAQQQGGGTLPSTYEISATVVDTEGNLVPTGADVLNTVIAPNTIDAGDTKATVVITVQYGKSGVNWNSPSEILSVTGEATGTEVGSSTGVYVLTNIADANNNGKIDLVVTINQDVTADLISPKLAEVDTFIEPLDTPIVPDGYKWADVGDLKWIDAYWDTESPSSTIGAAVNTWKNTIQSIIEGDGLTLETATSKVAEIEVTTTINAMNVALLNIGRLTAGYGDNTSIMAAKKEVLDCITKWNNATSAEDLPLWFDGTVLEDVIDTWETAFKKIIDTVNQDKIAEAQASVTSIDNMPIQDGKFYTNYTTVGVENIVLESGWTCVYVSTTPEYTGLHANAQSVNLRAGDNTIYLGLSENAGQDWTEVAITITRDSSATVRPAE